MNLLLFSLPAIIILGIITSYEDIHFGKIRNRWIVIAISYSLVLLILATIFMFEAGEKINPDYYKDFLSNIIITIIVGLMLWYSGLFSAGDSKLFLAYSMLMPLDAYYYGYVKGFPSFTLLVNTFVPIFILLLFFIILKTSLKQKKAVIKEVWNLKLLGRFALAIFAMTWLVKILFKIVPIPQNYFTMVLVLFLFLYALEKILPVNFVSTIIILAVLRLIFDFGNIITLEFLYNFLIIFFAMIFLRFFIIELGLAVSTKSVNVPDLMPGMRVAEALIIDKGEIKKQTTKYLDMVTYLQEKEKKYFIAANNKLTEEHIRIIRENYKKGKVDFNTLKVHVEIPFAPLMFLGVLLTVMVKGDFVIAIKIIILK